MAVLTLIGARLARSPPRTRRQDDLGDHEAENDESARDHGEAVHDAQEQQQADDRGDLDASTERGRHGTPAATRLAKGSDTRSAATAARQTARRDDNPDGAGTSGS